VRAEPAVVEASFRRAFASAPGLAFGPGHPPDELRRLERRWWRALVEKTFAGLGEFTNFDAYFDALFAFFGDSANWNLLPETIETLGRLKDRGLKLGVLSNFDYRIYGVLDGLGLTPYFDSIAISSEAGYAKPSAQLFKAVLNRHGLAANDAMHVGDSEALDFEGAAAAGLAAVLVDARCRPAVAICGRRARIASLAYVIEVAQRLRFA